MNRRRPTTLPHPEPVAPNVPRTAVHRPCSIAHRVAGSLAAVGVVLFLTSSAACSNEHARFCEETTAKLCAQCWQCAQSNEEASALCGLEAETDEAGCALILTRVCAADDMGYNTESARTCQERVERLSCEQLTSSKGKPEPCSRLF